MKAYCINLDRRPDRLAHMTAECDRHGIRFERISAVDGTDPGVAVDAARVPVGRLGARMSAGAYACFQSHRVVWRRIAEGTESHGMVLEDDVRMAAGIAAYQADGWVPGDADVVRLETTGIRVHVDRSGHEAHGRAVHRLRGYHPGTGCYVIAQSAALRLLGVTEAISDPVDYVMFHPGHAVADRLVTYQMLPAPVTQGVRTDAGADWASSSLTDRFAAGEPQTLAQVESLPGRLRRRISAEAVGLVRGMRYPVVEFG